MWPSCSARVVITYRPVAAHTRLQGPLFRRHSSASWWSHRGGIWPGWSHSLLWCSHPHPADHFCKTDNVPSADPSSLRASLCFPLSLRENARNPWRPVWQDLRGCGWAPGVGYSWRWMRDPAIPLLLTGVLWTPATGSAVVADFFLTLCLLFLKRSQNKIKRFLDVVWLLSP